MPFQHLFLKLFQENDDKSPLFLITLKMCAKNTPNTGDIHVFNRLLLIHAISGAQNIGSNRSKIVCCQSNWTQIIIIAWFTYANSIVYLIIICLRPRPNTEKRWGGYHIKNIIQVIFSTWADEIACKCFEWELLQRNQTLYTLQTLAVVHSV